MDSPKQTVISDELTNYCAHFFAASIVLAKPQRASKEELLRAREYRDKIVKYLLGQGYAPDKAGLMSLPEGKAREFAAITGQDGYIPDAAETVQLIIPGSKIQSILSHIYGNWFHNPQKS